MRELARRVNPRIRSDWQLILGYEIWKERLQIRAKGRERGLDDDQKGLHLRAKGNEGIRFLLLFWLHLGFGMLFLVSVP